MRERQHTRGTDARPTGYLHPKYARSLSEFGLPRSLPRSGGWILERSIEGFDYRDAMGCYPIFACRDWSQLHLDLDEIGNDLVSLTLVTDPFGDYSEAYLQRCFPNKCIPFKSHFVAELRRSPHGFVSNHHARYARKASEMVDVALCPEPIKLLTEWTRLYTHLIERHDIGGIAAFSESSFSVQLQVPGLVAFRAERQGETVSMILWYVQGNVAYYHLGASSPVGYECYASFALFWRAIQHFSERGVNWLSLGAGAGLEDDATDGLSRFKRGWSSETKTAYLCGRVFDRPMYDEVVRSREVGSTGYFPAYRTGEFG